MTIGRYDTRLSVLRLRETKDTTYGEAEKSWVADGSQVWGEVVELTAGARAAYGANEIRADVEISVRGFPTLDGKDRLRDPDRGFTYRLEGIRRGDEELICAAHRLTAGEE